MPSSFLFDQQDKAYQHQILPEKIIKVAIEMGTPDT